MQRTFIHLFLLGLLVVPISCIFNCGEISPHYLVHRYDGYFSFVADPGNGSGWDLSIEAGDSLFAQQLGITLYAHRSYTGDLGVPSNNILIPGAYALSCPEPGFNGSLQRMVSLSITSDGPYTSADPAGTDLSHYFEIAGTEGYRNHFELQPVSDFLSGRSPALSQMTLALIHAPDTVSAHVFTVEGVFSDGTTFEVTLPEVVLLP